MPDAAHIWSLGDYGQIAGRLAEAADALVAAAGVTRNARVLDVAAGHGNVALRAAALGAQVSACDIAPAMIARGRENTIAAGFDVDWREGDAQDLPYDDGSFDIVLSCFGAIFAPDPVRTAGELLRVTAPGGRVAMTTWLDGGIQYAAADVVSAAVTGNPPVPDHWSRPDDALGHFRAHGADAAAEHRTLRWVYPSPDAWVRFMETAVPPMVAARTAIGEAAWPSVREQLLSVASTHGTTTPEGFVLEPAYLLITATPVRGR